VKIVPGNRGEQTLAYQCLSDGLPPFVQNFIFNSQRKYEIDIAWPMHKVGVEIQGGVFTRGAHGSPMAILRDMDKSNLLVLDGWRVLRYTPTEVKHGKAMFGIKKLLGVFV
jgi:very-short-patch-repair endonuclease